MILRNALRELETRPNDDALELSARLHARLVDRQIAYSLFDPKFDPSTPDPETGRMPSYQVGLILTTSVNDERNVPIFKRFLRRSSIEKTCEVCEEAKFEIDYIDVPYWKETCADFDGDWMWTILLYPTSEILQCTHDLVICRACISKSISVALEKGPIACDRIKCPHEGCPQNFSHEEVKYLCDAATSER